MQLLQKKGKGDGSFLIRPNSRRPGYYALTLMYNAQPYHYEVVCEVSTLSSLYYNMLSGVCAVCFCDLLLIITKCCVCLYRVTYGILLMMVLYLTPSLLWWITT